MTAVHLMNHDVLPKCEATRGRIEVALLNNNREFCGRPDQHTYELTYHLDNIDHKTVKVHRQQSNGIVERCRRTIIDDHFRFEGRRTSFETIDEMQVALCKFLTTSNGKTQIGIAA